MARRRYKAEEIIKILREVDVLISEGLPDFIRSDNGPEFTAKAVRKWLTELWIWTLFIEPEIPWENAYIESFNRKLRNELQNTEVIDLLLEARVLIEDLRNHYNHLRPHSSLGYKPPAPEAIHLPPKWKKLLPEEIARCSETATLRLL